MRPNITIKIHKKKMFYYFVLNIRHSLLKGFVVNPNTVKMTIAKVISLPKSKNEITNAINIDIMKINCPLLISLFLVVCLILFL